MLSARRRVAYMESALRPSAFAIAILFVTTWNAALAQTVGVPENPEVANPAAAAAPSDEHTPEELVGKSTQDLTRGDVAAAARDDVTALRRGPLLIHGNYCGIGNRPGTPPIDLLDAACMRHDSCTHTGKMPSCTCDNRLHDDAVAIAQDPRTPAAVQVLATTVAASMVVLVCK